MWIEQSRPWVMLLAISILTACGGDAKDHKDHDHKDHGHKDHGHKDHDHDDDHVHVAPRGGTLVELGDHDANVELVIDAERKKFAAYVLDAHAENAARIAQPHIEILVQASRRAAGDKPTADFTIRLLPVANENTGEKVGDTSQFEIDLDSLQGLMEFEGVIKSITVKGKEQKDVKFRFARSSKVKG